MNLQLRFSQQELKDGKSHVTKLTDKWFQDIQVCLMTVRVSCCDNRVCVQASPLISELSDSADETFELNLRTGGGRD